jgi:hypothetical protein
VAHPINSSASCRPIRGPRVYDGRRCLVPCLVPASKVVLVPNQEGKAATKNGVNSYYILLLRSLPLHDKSSQSRRSISIFLLPQYPNCE